MFEKAKTVGRYFFLLAVTKIASILMLALLLGVCDLRAFAADKKNVGVPSRQIVSTESILKNYQSDSVFADVIRGLRFDWRFVTRQDLSSLDQLLEPLSKESQERSKERDATDLYLLVRVYPVKERDMNITDIQLGGISRAFPNLKFQFHIHPLSSSTVVYAICPVRGSESASEDFVKSCMENDWELSVEKVQFGKL